MFELLTDDENNLLKPEAEPKMLHSFDEKNIVIEIQDI